jgi:hypothetical protein
MTIATLFQLIPAILILTARGRWLTDRGAVFGCLLILAMALLTEEVFANVLHIQFHLALASALILALDIPGSRFSRVAYCVPLLVAPLCGPGAIVILPLFALRTAIEWDRARLVQTVALAFGSALQLLLFFTPNPLRGHLLDPATLSNVLFLRLVILPYATLIAASSMGELVYNFYLVGGPGWWLTTGLSLSSFGLLIYAVSRGGLDTAFWLVMSGLLLAVVSFGAGMLPIHPSAWFAPAAAERYNFLPLVLIGMGLIALSMRKDGRYRIVYLCLVVLTLMSGGLTFFHPIDIIGKGLNWQSEVAVWQTDHDHMITAWPSEWLIDLSDRDRPCSPPSLDNISASEPTYCEGSWLTFIVRNSKLAVWRQRK